jgi:4-hydroxy-tetrahydrodipicolinate reductase
MKTKKEKTQRRIKIGLYGFGRTGRLVADEFFKDGYFDLEWVVRRTHKENHKYATRLLGYDVNDAPIFSVNEISPAFFQHHPVDIIVDFSSAKAHSSYAPATDFGIKIISAISKYKENDLEALKALSEKTSVLCSPNIGESAPSRQPIPVQVGTLFRNKPAGDSGANRQVLVI